MTSDQSTTDLATPKTQYINKLWAYLSKDFKEGTDVTAQLVDIERLLANWRNLTLSDADRNDLISAEITHVGHKTRYDTNRAITDGFRETLSTLAKTSRDTSDRNSDFFLRNLTLSHGAILVSSMAFLGAAGISNEASALSTTVLDTLPIFMALSVFGFCTALITSLCQSFSTAMLGGFFMVSAITAKSLVEITDSLAAPTKNRKKIHSLFNVALWGGRVFALLSFGSLVGNTLYFGYRLI